MAAVTQSAPYVSILNARSREEAIASLVSELDVDHKLVYEAIMQRERVISTGIGIGIAIPHAKIAGIDEFNVVIGIVQHDGINWDAIDHLPVKLVILIC